MGPVRLLSPSNPLPCEIPPRLDKPTRLTAGTITVTLLGIGISISISLFVLTRLGRSCGPIT